MRRAFATLGSAALVVAVASHCATRRSTLPRDAAPTSGPDAARNPIIAKVLDESSRIALHVAPEIMVQENKDVVGSPEAERRPEEDRRRVRGSVDDLQRILTLLAKVSVEVQTEPPPAPSPHDDVYRIVIGPWAEKLHGAPGIHAPYAQGFRVVVGARGAALYGESGLATSYAVYELLDRLGCRWFFPGPLGEVLPAADAKGRLELPLLDERRAPATIYRGVWYADDAWMRRNRQGGLNLDAGHALELRYVTDTDRKKHPDWRATVGGKAHPSRLKWSNAGVAQHVADRILQMHETDGAPSYSIAPDDGVDFDDSPADRALDAGDRDPTMNEVSLTDRFMVLANRIASRVAEKEPDVLLGFLAYVQYTRPPVREPVHPSLVPQIAPITYSRAHPMSDDRVPGNVALRQAIQGWGKKARATSIYFYGWFLSEPVAPNPLITKWGSDVPFVLANNAKLWQPETLPTFESNMHGLYLGMRLAFDPSLKPDAVFEELENRLYGAAALPMREYWRYVDRAWVDTPEYSGGPHGHARRFTKERLLEMRRLMDRAKAATATDVERARISLADDALSLFEDFMAMRMAFLEGRFAGLDDRGARYKARATALGEKWASAAAFAKTDYEPKGIYAHYYEGFQEKSYADAARIAKSHVVDALVTDFRFDVDRNNEADRARAQTELDDKLWKTTKVTVDTWSALGLHDYFGAVWYRAKVTLKPIPAGKRALVWTGDADGTIRVFVNGKEATYAKRPGGPATAQGFALPLAWDASRLLVEGENTIAIHAKRGDLNELGVGGLDAPVVIAHQR